MRNRGAAERDPGSQRHGESPLIPEPARSGAPPARVGDRPPARTLSCGPTIGERWIATGVGVWSSSDGATWVERTEMLGRSVAEPFADNGAFILNAVESLTGSDDLISLRTRASNDRPFIVVQALQQKAQLKYRETQDELQTSLSRAPALAEHHVA